MGVSLRSKSGGKPGSEHETNRTPAQEEEEAGLPLKPAPVCAKGLSLGLGSRGHAASLPLLTPKEDP